MLQSVDGGQTWQPMGGQLPADIMTLTAAGGNPETLYVTSMGSGLLRSTDGGNSWAGQANVPGPGNVISMAADPTSPQTVFAGTSDGMYRSADGGGVWTKLAFPGSNVAAIAVSPSRPSVVLAVGINNRQGLVYRSEDGGATWAEGNK